MRSIWEFWDCGIRDESKLEANLLLHRRFLDTQGRFRENSRHEILVAPHSLRLIARNSEKLTVFPHGSCFNAAMASRAYPMPPNTDALGRALVRLLRHSAVREGLDVRPDGFALLSRVLSIPSIARLRPSIAAVEHVVRICPKQRLSLRDEAGALYIRANQGHTIRSIEDEKLLTPITDPEVRALIDLLGGKILASPSPL